MADSKSKLCSAPTLSYHTLSMSLSRSLAQLALNGTRASTSATPLAARTFSSSSSSSQSSSSTPAPASPSPSPLTRPELAHPSLHYLRQLARSPAASDPHALLSSFDPILDVHPDKRFSSPAATRPGQKADVHVTLFNDTPNNKGYQQPRPSDDLLDGLPGEDDSVGHLAQVTHLSAGEIRNLYRFPLVVKRVVTMKSKGKMPSMYALTVVGNGKGLVGVGEGKDETAQKAVQKAFNQAVRSMDYVERYEDRTVWGTMRSNFGTCKIEMRSRPPGT